MHKKSKAKERFSDREKGLRFKIKDDSGKLGLDDLVGSSKIESLHNDSSNLSKKIESREKLSDRINDLLIDDPHIKDDSHISNKMSDITLNDDYYDYSQHLKPLGGGTFLSDHIPSDGDLWDMLHRKATNQEECDKRYDKLDDSELGNGIQHLFGKEASSMNVSNELFSKDDDDEEEEIGQIPDNFIALAMGSDNESKKDLKNDSNLLAYCDASPFDSFMETYSDDEDENDNEYKMGLQLDRFSDIIEQDAKKFLPPSIVELSSSEVAKDFLKHVEFMSDDDDYFNSNEEDNSYNDMDNIPIHTALMSSHGEYNHSNNPSIEPILIPLPNSIKSSYKIKTLRHSDERIKEYSASNKGEARPDNETKEERKARKLKVKQEKQKRRIDKKDRSKH